MFAAVHPKVLFITVANNRIGFGHLNRCLSVAALAVTMGIAPQFVIFGDELAAAQVRHSKFPFQMLPVTDLVHEFRSELVDAAVVDVVYPAFFRDGNVPMNLFRPLRQTASVIAAIDSLGEETIAERAREVPVDFLVVPYALAEADRARLSTMGCTALAGPDYALLSSNYINLPQREQRTKADRVLVTCGGSDPLGWTSVVLRSLESVVDPLIVRVIAGPLFSAALRADIAELAATSSHCIEVVDAPGNMAVHMQWCDIAIAASGLTKYELAASGTPAILFSIDTYHDVNNRAFATLQVMQDLGAAPSPKSIVDAVNGLLADRDRREAMAASGRNVVDGRGGQRLIAKIMEKLSC